CVSRSSGTSRRFRTTVAVPRSADASDASVPAGLPGRLFVDSREAPCSLSVRSLRGPSLEQVQMETIWKNWRDLSKPRDVRIEPGTRSETYARFIAEPLERGYGYTLGGALRRVLLSSLQGTAVTAVRIEGALHEFQTLSDVRED